MLSIRNLIERNQRYIQDIKSSKAKSEKHKVLTQGQSPNLLVITCSDSRVIPEKIFDMDEGEVFVIRSAGNVINEGELASVEYGIEHLHIKTVVVLGHTLCGAIHAAKHKETGKYLRPILDNIGTLVTDDISELELTKANCTKQVNYLKEKFPEYDGEFIPLLYDICTNKVETI